MNSKYTCIACRVAFTNVDIQRLHFKTDWHRYNLKRKVAELPPVTSEDFQKKVLDQRQTAAQDQKSGIYCKVCRKSFQSEETFVNHLNSKKHKENVENKVNNVTELNVANVVKAMNDISCPSNNKVTKAPVEKNDSESICDTDSDVEEVDSDEWDDDISDNNPILNHNCLFCSHHSSNFLKNVKHMSTAHSFFIPDAEYLVDLRGLLLYLGQKVCEGFLCLWCNDHGKSFHSLEAAQNHMLDKGHCKMLHEGEALLEYADFYDYRSSYPDYVSIANDDDNDEVQLSTIEETDFQLVLPSGATIGHRSLMRYYRQSFDPNKEVAPMQKKINRVIAQYRSLGWRETDKQVAVKKAKDISFMRRVQNKHMLKVSLKANKFQKHYRPQVNF